ncbi:Sec-independent protein translocase TatC [Halobellus salinus]|uniref:Sec-independent protein translocase protein TatC n=1 Tax=Halobellus salinus TaxID=931585 RepID=A0A830ESF8_9EURY|nr:twin-arginine translocase subunit TatC [Halobellus salinus]GGJ05471.1 Sec-independent protein translocase TatC [Halobellus salinus]SMP23566.1 sec-independent protein translocase protein TatC [Halobellus salinus]
MSSALDNDTRATLNAGRETAGAMLRAAQKDLQKVFVFFLVGFLGTFYALRLYIWDFLKRVTRARMSAQVSGDVSIIAQTPFDVILLQAKIGLVVGVVLAVPSFVYFSQDALKERDLWPSSPVPAWQLALIFAGILTLFVAGVAYGYYVFFPFTFAFLAQNAIAAGFTPTYSIVKWAQFIFLLTASFGLASQLPLAMTGLSYAEIVPYETFRDKWRYAVVAVFAVGALFTPPDPFTQIMWAIPVLSLYGFSLYLAKVVTTARRGSERMDVRGSARAHWNTIAGTAAVGGFLVYAFFARGGVSYVDRGLAAIGSDYVVTAPESSLVLGTYVTIAAVAAAAIALGYFVYNDLDDLAVVEAGIGDPAAIDLGDLDAGGVRAAPPEVFATLDEEAAMAAAGDAIDAGDKEKAQAIVNRFDEDGGVDEAAEDEPQSEPAADSPAGSVATGDGSTSGGIADRATRASGAFFDAFSSDTGDGDTADTGGAGASAEGDAADDDFEGYYTDLRFILDSITSGSFRIVGLFMIVLAGVFGWLYTGGIKRVYEDFLARLPAQVRPEEVLNIVALHPMEALVFEVKLSTIIAALVTLPLIAYYAWPAFRDRSLVRHRRRAVFAWTGALTAGLLGGFALGYTTIAPSIISGLVNDAVVAEMVIAYRITNFFWLIFFTTAGIGLLADVPILMILLNTTGVGYDSMRGRWREVTVAVLAAAALFTPADVLTMFIVTIPLMAAYGAGLGILFVVTLGGRRDLAAPRADVR